MLAEAKRWLVDRFSHNEDVTNVRTSTPGGAEQGNWEMDHPATRLRTVHPKESIAAVESDLARLTPTERSKLIEHVKAYANLYYQGRHNVAVPEDVRARVGALERRAVRLNTVDAAREIVAKYGGPPTRQTVIESLERSQKEWLGKQAKPAPHKAAAAQQQKSEGVSAGVGW